MGADSAVRLPIRRNTALLSAALAANSATMQLMAAMSSITLARALGANELIGLGPAIVFATAALAAVPSGRLMDRVGRVPVLVAGFATGAAGCALIAAGSASGFAPAVPAGLVGVGVASATALLARTAAGDMYPPERRARGIALVLFGAVFGAILGPAVFGPLAAGRELDGDALAVLWIAGAGFMVVAAVITACVRPDPRTIAMILYGGSEEQGLPAPPAASVAQLLRRPGVLPALVAAQASFAVMVGVMTLTGAIVVDHFHHDAQNVFPILGLHVLGMYGLVIVVGALVDRIGRTISLAGGLLLMGLSAGSLAVITSVPATAAALFALGLGWNLSYVAAAAVLADRTEPWERGKLLGFNDLLSGATGVTLILTGGAVLSGLGVVPLAIGAMALAITPAIWILWDAGPRCPTRVQRV